MITISHQLGSGGYVVAQKAAEQLGYRVVGPGMLADVAEERELSVERLRRLGRAKPGLLDRLAAETQLYLAVIQNAVTEAAFEDNIVLVGRGGQWLLRGVPHALCVRVVAHLDTRVEAQDGRVHEMTAGAPDAVARVARAVAGVAGVTIEETPVLPPMSLM